MGDDTPEKIEIKLVDQVSDEPCPKCGSTLWIVDGDGGDRFWLLCLGNNASCIETRPLPERFKVVE
jgi:ssDNA-binding Zn-finger/Zn-ribbon topoisomerase 1